MNPEFRRQLWLNVSFARLVAIPVVFGLMFVLVGVSSSWNRRSLALCALYLATALSALLGGAAAIESVASEGRARTWDWQRLSGLGPWSMTWGKLAGSTLLAHYGACIAYAVFLLVGGAARDSVLGASASASADSPLIIALLGLALGALAQSAGMLVATWQIARGGQQASPAASYILSAATAGLMLVTLGATDRPDPYRLRLEWYGLTFSPAVFLLISALAFFGWSVLATYRLLRTELEKQSAPVVTLGFAIFLAAYYAGIVSAPWGAAIRGNATVRWFAAEIAIAGIAYACCLFATMRQTELKRWVLLLRSDKRLAWAQTPAWIACCSLSLITGIAIAGIISSLGEQSGAAAAMSVALPLLVVRDAGIVLAIRLRGGPLASDAWTLVVCGCLHGLVAPVVATRGPSGLRAFLSLDPNAGWHAVPVLMCEILLLAWVVGEQWRGEQQTQKV